MVEITEEQYQECLDVLPPIYIRLLNGEKIQSGFAIMEPLNHHSDGTIISQVCFRKDDKYLTTDARIYKADGSIIDYSDYQVYTSDNIAISDQREVKDGLG